jgi:ribosomal protein S18 acetylase RimI-like enzyme
LKKDLYIRPATLEDTVSLRELAIRSFVNAYEQYNTAEDVAKYLADNFNAEKINSELTDNRILILLAVKENHIVGYAKLLFQSDLKTGFENPLEIARLYTRVDLIGAGIGKFLIDEICKYAAQNDFDAVCLGVWQKNPNAIRFYEREGFVISGTTSFLFGTDLQEDFVMHKRITGK